MSYQQGSQRASVQSLLPSTSLHVTAAAHSHAVLCTFIMILWWGMSCSYTDYSSLGSCLIVWLLVFLAPLDLFSRMLPHSEISAITSQSTVLIELMARATRVKNPHVKDLAKLAAQLERLLLQNEPLLCGRCSDKTWKHGITNLQPEADGGFYNCVCVWGDNESLIMSFCLCCQICFWNTVGRVSINMFFRAY